MPFASVVPVVRAGCVRDPGDRRAGREEQRAGSSSSVVPFRAAGARSTRRWRAPADGAAAIAAPAGAVGLRRAARPARSSAAGREARQDEDARREARTRGVFRGGHGGGRVIALIGRPSRWHVSASTAANCRNCRRFAVGSRRGSNRSAPEHEGSHRRLGDRALQRVRDRCGHDEPRRRARGHQPRQPLLPLRRTRKRSSATPSSA